MALRSKHATNQAEITDTLVIPPKTFGDFIVFYRSRGLAEVDDRAAVEALSLQARTEVVAAVQAAGSEMLPRPHP